MSSSVKAVAAGYHHSLLLKKDGSVWATGRNRHGQFGNGCTMDKNAAFVQVIPTGVKAVAAGLDHNS